MNFVFISPAFPTNYYNFCDRLKRNGVNILGIGDTPYDQLDPKVKNSLNEYYKVNTLESYDEVFKAVAFFSFKYGKIDFLESNNEYWLRQDAKLREDFNIKGAKPKDVEAFTTKSMMKDFYIQANVPVARYHHCTSFEEDMKFIELVGYPVIVKPNVGVGAAATYKINCEQDLRNFYNEGFYVPYIMEEFITGNITSLDGICDADSNIIFADNAVFPPSIMDIVNKNLEVSYYINKEVPKDIFDIGQRVLKAFNIKSRFFHLEFFRLTKRKDGIGEVGDIVALEVNMRPPGGITPDMINYSQSVDSYQIYADMICYNQVRNVNMNQQKFYCCNVARRDRFNYVYSIQDIKNMFSYNICMAERVSEVFSAAMGNDYFVAKFNTLEEVNNFTEIVLRKW
jgi:hypothetical protein